MTRDAQSTSETTDHPDDCTSGLPLSQETVAMIAHELRSPLNVISNVLTACRASIAPASMPAAADVLSRQVNRALRLVGDLMDLTRFGEEGLRFDPLPIEFTRVIRNIAQDREQEFRARRQALILELPAESMHVRGDVTRLGQIVGNLLENACKYSPDGARIVLALSHEEGQAVLSVRDGGDGISAEDMPRIFEPYFRGGRSARASPSGLGLGLTLTRRLVQLHGGTIEAQSAGEGSGSEFTVRLPAHRRA